MRTDPCSCLDPKNSNLKKAKKKILWKSDRRPGHRKRKERKKKKKWKRRRRKSGHKRMK